MPIYHNDGLDDPLNFDGSNAFTGCASSPAPDAIDKPLCSDMLNITVDRMGNAVTRSGIKHQGRPYQGQISRAFTFFDCQGNPQLIAVAGGAFKFKNNQKLPEWGQMVYPPGGAVEAPYYPPKIFGTGPQTDPPPPPPDEEVELCGFTATTTKIKYNPFGGYFGDLSKPPGYDWAHACLRRFAFCYLGGPDHTRSLNDLFSLDGSMTPINELFDHFLLSDNDFAQTLLDAALLMENPLPTNFYLQVVIEFDRPQHRETNALYGNETNSRWRILYAIMKY